jgi:hypothetical protein
MPKVGGARVDATVDGKRARVSLISEAMLRVDCGAMFAIISKAHEDGKMTYRCVGASSAVGCVS